MWYIQEYWKPHTWHMNHTTGPGMQVTQSLKFGERETLTHFRFERWPQNSVREQQRRMSWIYVSNNKWVTPEQNSPTVPCNRLFIFLPSVCSRNIMSPKCKQSRASGPQSSNEGDVTSGISIRVIIRAETIHWLIDSSVDRRWLGDGSQNRLIIRVTCDDENDKH